MIEQLAIVGFMISLVLVHVIGFVFFVYIAGAIVMAIIKSFSSITLPGDNS